MSDAKMQLESASRLSARLKPRAARLFFLGVEEDDLLKKFLYLFMVIEIVTQTAYKALDHDGHVRSIMQGLPPRLGPEESLKKAQRTSEHLGERFAWCRLRNWSTLTDADVAEFGRLKKLRDQILHGQDLMPTHADAETALKLAGVVMAAS